MFYNYCIVIKVKTNIYKGMIGSTLYMEIDESVHNMERVGSESSVGELGRMKQWM